MQIVIYRTKANQEVVILVLGDLNASVGHNAESCCGVIGKEGENDGSPNGEIYSLFNPCSSDIGCLMDEWVALRRKIDRNGWRVFPLPTIISP